MADWFQENEPAASGGDWFAANAPSKPGEPKPGLETFKSNMGQVGTVGEYLHAARAALGLPSLDDLMHAPAALLNWAKHGNPPSGGFLSENPVADAFTDATAAAMPPDLASARAAAGDAAKATADAAGAAVKAFAKGAAPDVGAGAAKAGAGLLASEVLPGGPLKYVAGAAPIYSGSRQIGRGLSKGWQAAKGALRPAEDTELLDGIAQGMGGGRSFAEMSPEEQAHIRDLASRLNAGARPSVAGPAPQVPRPRSHYGLPEEPPAPAAVPAPAPQPAAPAGPPDEVLQAVNSGLQQGAEAAPGPSAPPAPESSLSPPPEELAQINTGVQPQPTPATPARTNGRLSRAQMQQADQYTLARRTKSAEEMAQFLTKDPKQTQGLIEFLTEQPEGIEGDQLHAVQDARWKQLKTLMKQDQLANIQNSGGRVGQEDVMKLKNVTAPDPATRRMAIKRAQEILQQQKAVNGKTAPGGGMGAMKKFRTDYNPAALTDQEIEALHQ